MGILSSGCSKFFLLFVFFTFWLRLTQAQTPEQKYISLTEAVNLMLTNNPHAKNARLQVELSEAGKKSALDIHPTEFTYYYWQLNGITNNRYFEVSQNFGSPLAHYYKRKINKEDFKYRKTQTNLTLNKLTAQLKSLWFEWIFAQNKVALIEEELKIFEEMLDGFFSDTITINNNQPSVIRIQTQYADIQNRNFQASQDYKLAANKIKSMLFTTNEIAPADTTLEMYAITPKTSGPDKFYPASHVQLYNENLTLKRWESNYERAKLLPEITAGYFNQKIEHLNGLKGVMIGLTVPLWFMPQKVKIKQALIQQNIARNELDYNTFDLELSIENLKIELDKLFVQISFYSENVLKQVENEEQALLTRSKTNDIPLTEFLDEISVIYFKRLTFLETIKQYNQVAVELEFLVN